MKGGSGVIKRGVSNSPKPHPPKENAGAPPRIRQIPFSPGIRISATSTSMFCSSSTFKTSSPLSQEQHMVLSPVPFSINFSTAFLAKKNIIRNCKLHDFPASYDFFSLSGILMIFVPLPSSLSRIKPYFSIIILQTEITFNRPMESSPLFPDSDPCSRHFSVSCLRRASIDAVLLSSTVSVTTPSSEEALIPIRPSLILRKICVQNSFSTSG